MSYGANVLRARTTSRSITFTNRSMPMLRERQPNLLRSVLLLVAVVWTTTTLNAQSHITSPIEYLGANVGDDYFLANYTQLTEYWRILESESPRLVVEDIGPTADGRTQYMAIVTSEDNHANLDRYKDISRSMALAEGLTQEQARALAREGKAVVWIDGGLHGTEIVGAQQLIEMAYQMVSRNDDETLRMLDDVILLLVPANPDGMEWVSDWYMRVDEPTERSTSGLPFLYHKYVGHDNNRDSYMVTQPETENMARILYREWMPQIMYNHHQTGPSGTIMWAPPFRDPFNYNFDPLLLMGIEMVGNAMHSRFVLEGKPGTAMRNGGPFSTWWNGGLRTTAYFHNIIGLLTETNGNPTPIEIPFLPNKLLPTLDMVYPIAPQEWHFRQSIEYCITANKAIIDYASRYRETLLLNIYTMGANSIDRGSRDNWTFQPKDIDALYEQMRADGLERQLDALLQGPYNGYFSRGVPREYYDRLHDPDKRDPRGYIIPSDQADFPTAARFVNTLIKNGVTVLQASRDFDVGGKTYPAGSFAVKAAQAFRPHVIDMFEPQNHPNDFAYEGAAPTPPYDNAGWTLAFQMGVEVDRILEGFDGPFEEVQGYARPLPGTVSNASGAVGYLMSHSLNDASVITNRILADREEVYWLADETSFSGTTYPEGTLYIPASAVSPEVLGDWATNLGVDFHGIGSIPNTSAFRLSPIRIGLWDRYGGSMPSGWTRWLLERFEFPHELVFPQELDDGDLRDNYDVLIFPTGAIPAASGEEDEFARYFRYSPDPETVPSEYRDRLGNVTTDNTVPMLLEFLEEGGTILTIGSSTSMGQHAELPIANHLIDGDGNQLRAEEYYVPGSVLEARVDNTRPLAYGLNERVDLFFNNSPVFRLLPASAIADVRPIVWFDEEEPLQSGWAWGQHRLFGGVAVLEASIGEGRLYLYGPEVINRGQPHGTFKLFFNGIHLAGAEPVELGDRR